MVGKIIIFAGVFTVLALTYFGWKLTARGAYESAEYTVRDSDAPFEIREYPDLVLAATNDALTQAKNMMNDGMGELTKGMNIPGMPGLM